MTTITEDYVSFEIAKLLKKKGFNEASFYGYNNKAQIIGGGLYYSNDTVQKNIYTAPTQAMAMKWLRKVHNIIIEPESVWNGKKWEYLLFIVTPQNADSPYYEEHNLYKSYEECVEAGIKYCLENLI